jgi:hypothetical protein
MSVLSSYAIAPRGSSVGGEEVLVEESKQLGDPATP